MGGPCFSNYAFRDDNRARDFVQFVRRERTNSMRWSENTRSLRKGVEPFLPREGYFLTAILIYVNIALFIFMAMSGLGFMSFNVRDLLDWGANYGPITRGGEFWRLVTNIFLHGGLMHVLANVYGLLFVGIFLEPLLGRVRFLIIYLLTGVIGSISSVLWYEATVSVGASGAILGLYGLFISLMLTKVFPTGVAKALLLNTIIFVGYSLLTGLIGRVDNAAHIGGLLSGFAIGLILSPRLKYELAEMKGRDDSK